MRSRQPLPPFDNFLFHHGDVSRWTTKANHTQFEKNFCQLTQPIGVLMIHCRGVAAAFRQ
jgi:hypothetical protein